MILTPRDVSVLTVLAHVCVATAAQIRRQCFPNDPDGRITRRRLAALFASGLIQKTRMEVVNPVMSGMSAPVYFSARKGLEFLATHCEDPSYLSRSSQKPQWVHLAHWVALTDLHLLIDAAAARDSGFTLANWTNEYDEIQHDGAPEERYRLYTLLNQKPRLVSSPDYLFTLTSGAHTKVFFGELERGTNHPEKAAAEKSPGYAELARRKMHRRFCAEAGDKFLVLVTAPDVKWRDYLVKAFSTKQEPTLYRIAALNDLTPETFFREPVWKRTDGTIGSLVKAQEGVREPVPSGVLRASEGAQSGRDG